MMHLTLLIFAISTIASLVFIVVLFSTNSDLKDEVNRLKSELSKAKEYNKELNSSISNKRNDLILIQPGDQVVLPDYHLVSDKGGSKEHSFSLTYELDVLEISTDKVKVKAIGFTTNDTKINADKSLHPNLLAFMENKWINKSQVQLIINNTKIRDMKLDQLL